MATFSTAAQFSVSLAVIAFLAVAAELINESVWKLETVEILTAASVVHAFARVDIAA